MDPLPSDTMRARKFKTGRTVMALILREMSTTYGRSPGGYLWAILEPIGAIVVLSLGFSLIVNAPALGTSFIMFFATGFLPFSIYNSVSNAVARSLNFSRPLLKYPGVTFVDAILARFLLNGMTQWMVFYIVIFGIMILQDTGAILDFPPILISLVMVAAIGLGVGMINCVLFGLFPIWMQLWSIFSRPLFLASGVLFIYDDMPKTVQDILWYNPLMHVIGLMRTGFYANYDATYVSLSFGFGVAAVFTALGLVLLGRYHADILKR